MIIFDRTANGSELDTRLGVAISGKLFNELKQFFTKHAAGSSGLIKELTKGELTWSILLRDNVTRNDMGITVSLKEGADDRRSSTSGGTKYWVNVEGNPTKLAVIYNDRPARLLNGGHILLLPWRVLIKITKADVQWPSEFIEELKTGRTVVVHKLGTDFYFGSSFAKSSMAKSGSPSRAFVMTLLAQTYSDIHPITTTNNSSFASLLTGVAEARVTPGSGLGGIGSINYESVGIALNGGTLASRANKELFVSFYLKDLEQAKYRENEITTRELPVSNSIRVSTTLFPLALRILMRDGPHAKHPQYGRNVMLSEVFDFFVDEEVALKKIRQYVFNRIELRYVINGNPVLIKRALKGYREGSEEHNFLKQVQREKFKPFTAFPISKDKLSALLIDLGWPAKGCYAMNVILFLSRAKVFGGFKFSGAIADLWEDPEDRKGTMSLSEILAEAKRNWGSFSGNTVENNVKLATAKDRYSSALAISTPAVFELLPSFVKKLNKAMVAAQRT